MRRLNKNIIIVLLIIIALMFIYTLINKDESKLRTVIKIPVEKCKSQHQKCEAKLGKFKIEISFDKNVLYLKPFTVSVLTESKANVEIESIQVDFKMKGMYMGVNRFMLSKISSENLKQKWRGKALLPVCVTGRADWFSELEVVTKQNKYILLVPVLVKQPVN